MLIEPWKSNTPWRVMPPQATANAEEEEVGKFGRS
jgi:hypothetical protein